MISELTELSPAKLNLFLKIVSKREDGFHNLRSGITIINLFDEVFVEKSSEFKVKYIGEFAPKNNSFKNCIVKKIFSKFDIKKPNYCFTIKKNIPIQSGLGSASSNAAAIIRILKKLNYKEIKKINFSKIGADVPFFIHNQDSLVRGVGDIIIKKIFPKYYFLLIKPMQNCSTAEIYNQIKIDNINFDMNYDTDEITENDNGNDFESIVNNYNEISKMLKYMKNFPDIIFSRLTGSGSCIYSTFENMNSAKKALQIFREKFPEHWSSVVENNFVLK